MLVTHLCRDRPAWQDSSGCAAYTDLTAGGPPRGAMSKKRRSYEAGHSPKFMVVIDDSPECDRALYFASRRALRIGATVLMLRVIFQVHLLNVIFAVEQFLVGELRSGFK